MATKIYMYTNMSHIVKRVLIQISNLKAFCNRHLKPYQALEGSTYIQGMKGHAAWLSQSTGTQEEERELGMFRKEENGCCHSGAGKGRRDSGVCGGVRRSPSLSLIKKANCISFQQCGPGNYNALNMTAWLKIFSLRRDQASANTASLDLLLKAICKRGLKTQGSNIK